MTMFTETPMLVPGSVALLDISQGTVTGLGLLGVLALLLFSGFFASAEIAIFSLGNHRITALLEDGTPGAKTLSTLKADPRRLLVTILVGNNIANIGMSAITTGLLGLSFSPGEAVIVATFFWSTQYTLFPSIVGDYYGQQNSSANYALLYSGKMWGGVFGGAVSGWLVTTVGWSTAFIFGGILAIIAGAAAVVLRPPAGRTAV